MGNDASLWLWFVLFLFSMPGGTFLPSGAFSGQPVEISEGVGA